MANIKNKNELKRRTELFLDEFSHEEYKSNEEFCKETMLMMREFIGHASHLLDCADAKIKKAKRTARNKAIDEFAERLKSDEFQKYDLDMVFETSRDLSYTHSINAFHEYIDKIAEQMKGGGK